MNVRFRDRDFSNFPLPDLTFRPLRYRTVAQGGPQWAEIRADGHEDELYRLLNWLRYDVEIQDGRGTPLWWGYVNKINITGGAQGLGVNLDDMANRVAYVWSGDNESGVTDWAEDESSIANYGTKELLEPVTGVTATGAEQKRDWKLDQRRYPTAVEDPGSPGYSYAILTCSGWFESLDWTYYDRDEGLVEYATSAGVGQKVGWGVTSDRVGFTDRNRAVSSLFSRLNSLDKGDKIKITNSTSNNTTLTVESSTERERVTYTADTIAFLRERRKAVNEYIRASHEKWRNLNNFNLWAQRDLAVTTLSEQSGVIGTHTGGGDAANLTDSTKSWTTDEWVDRRITNVTDGSEGTVKSNTADTIVASLFGGADNDWDNGDSYIISPNEIWVADASTIASGDRIRIELDSAAYHETFVRGTPDTATGKVSLEDALPSRASSGNDIDLVYRWVTDAGNSTFYTEGTDYQFDAADGQIYVEDSGAIANNQVIHVSYSYNEYRIEDSDLGLGFIGAGDMISTVNTVTNNRFLRVLSAGMEGDRVTVRELVDDEPPGASITISRGSNISVTESLVDELPGATLTITAWGSRAVQSFVVPSDAAWTANLMGVRVAKVGSPIDSFRLDIQEDTAGEPGAFVDGIDIPAAELSTQMAWTFGQLTNTDSLTAGDTYWVRCGRSGDNDPENYYIVAVDEDLGYGSGELLLWDGAAWQTRPDNADMPFQILGAEETTVQIAVLIDQEGQFLTGVDILNDSGLETNQYRDGRNTAKTELLDLLELGTSNGKRLLGTVTRERVLRVVEEPAKPTMPEYTIDMSGEIKTKIGGRLPLGDTSFVGQWIERTGMPPTANFTYINSPSPYLVEAAEYDIEGKTYIIEPAGGLPVWRVGMSIDEG